MMTQLLTSHNVASKYLVILRAAGDSQICQFEALVARKDSQRRAPLTDIVTPAVFYYLTGNSFPPYLLKY